MGDGKSALAAESSLEAINRKLELIAGHIARALPSPEIKPFLKVIDGEQL
jgi:hypothetical protein